MKIGLISDTHGYLDPKVVNYFSEVDEIWHAGDVGGVDVIEQLEAFKPLKGVYGNIDGREVRSIFPETLFFDCGGMSVCMIHIGGKPGSYTKQCKSLISSYNPQIFICGHSHILRVVSDVKYNNMLYLNPGAAGIHGFHHVRTLLRFEISQGSIKNMQAIELGPRAQKKRD